MLLRSMPACAMIMAISRNSSALACSSFASDISATGTEWPSPTSQAIQDVKTAPGYRSVAYYVNWAIYGRNFKPQDLPADSLTHLLYAFANVRPETGEVYLSDPHSDTDQLLPSDAGSEIGRDAGNNLYGSLKQLYILKKANRNLKVLLSIGGWTYSSNFARPVATELGRRTFAKSAVALLKDLPFDGIDIDWECPASPQEGENFVALLAACREELDAYEASLSTVTRFLLTIASPAGTSHFPNYPFEQMDPYLDFWNLMGYDFAGSWDQLSGHQANIYSSPDSFQATPFSVDGAVQHYRSHGVPSHKIVVGMPLYGRAFLHTDGPGSSFEGVGQGSWEDGIWDLKALPRPGAEVHYDPTLVASWSYDPSSRTMVSYDSSQAVTDKVGYIKKTALGGAMWWETSADRPKNGSASGSLIDLAFGSLSDKGGMGIEMSDNCLEYPISKYVNLKQGMSDH